MEDRSDWSEPQTLKNTTEWKSASKVLDTRKDRSGTDYGGTREADKPPGLWASGPPGPPTALRPRAFLNRQRGAEDVYCADSALSAAADGGDHSSLHGLYSLTG